MPFAIDGLFDTFLTVLNQMEVFPAVIDAERDRYLPFLLTTTIMMEAVKAGAGREDAHSAIKEHAVATVRELREGKIKENDLVSRLANDSRVGLGEKELQNLLEAGEGKIGAARQQVAHFVKRANKWAEKYPEAKAILHLPFCKSFIFAEFAPGAIDFAIANRGAGCISFSLL